MRLSLISAITLALLTGFSTSAAAWEIKTTNTGQPIRWAEGELVIGLNMSAAMHGISVASGEAEAKAAFGAWGDVLGSNLTLSFEQATAGVDRDGANVVSWGTDASDPSIDPEALATTYLSYRTTTGQALEADIVVNAVNYEWTTAPGEPSVMGATCNDRYDLQNILAHEIGHLLGIAHSVDHSESTMFPSAGKCETQKRALADDDRDAATFLYENVPSPGAGLDQLVGCSSGGSGGFWGALLVLGLLALLRGHDVLAIAIGVVLMVGQVGNADASTLLHLTATELVDRSDMIVQGQVVAQNVVLQNGQPTTISTIAVSGCDDGDCPAKISVSQPGGEVGDVGLIVSGVHVLQVGSELVLFLRNTKAGLRPVGRAQGVFTMMDGKRGPQLERDLGGLVLTRGDRVQIGTRSAMSRTQFDLLFGHNLLKTKRR